jgi:hypothetical protein
MRANLWKHALRIAAGTMGILILLSLAGRALPHRLLTLHTSATTERGLVLGNVGIGSFHASDPSGYGIPFMPRWQEVVDLPGPAWSTASGSRFLLVRNETVYTSKRGGVIRVNSWFASYLPLAIPAAIVLAIQGTARGFARVAMAWRALHARRLRRRYPEGQHCPACGYDVRMSNDRCPECGQPFVRRTIIAAAT